MTTVVRVRTPDAEYAIPVDRVSEVRSAAGVTALLEPREGVAGLMSRGVDTITVLSVLARDGQHVLVVHAGELSFGLLVSEVTVLQQVDEGAIGPPPVGQARQMAKGVLTGNDGLVLLLDVDVLASWLSA